MCLHYRKFHTKHGKKHPDFAIVARVYSGKRLVSDVFLTQN